MHELSGIERAPPTSNSIIILDTYFFHSMLAVCSLSDQAVYNFKDAKSVHQHFYAGEIDGFRGSEICEMYGRESGTWPDACVRNPCGGVRRKRRELTQHIFSRDV